ncbi:gliding motility protein GldL [Reichenbachiella sp. 5M10]|uniref:type IX secretion system motor protein PorL/GldL n=1 Tax=Reichenbachiella sp. 5M10 TaxID=1889772 RepID=UPI000C14ABCA|nr:gliding motility protein GldL [Reichenbachiella sp. 5M10]PIB37290.1 gliding motility protein GldL [Reichenbachiella sp. 5M10]
MSAKKGGLKELLFTTIMPKVYGIGAAVVIVGAMFKILHLPGAGEMLGIGLTTEAIIFFLSAFEPKHNEIDWSKVYPELSDDYDGPRAQPRAAVSAGGTGVAQQMDKMLADAKVGPELIKSLGDGMKSMSESAKKLSTIGDAAGATNEYAQNVKSASTSLINMNKAYASTATSMAAMADASKDASAFHAQVQNVTKNLGALNAVYEMELKDANSHVKAMNKFYANVTSAMEGMAEAAKDTENFRSGMTKLNTNITSLNSIYGNMLSAMRGGGDSSAK